MIQKVELGWFVYFWDDKVYMPLRVIENINKSGRDSISRLDLNLQSIDDVAKLVELLYEFQNECFKYRKYFKDNNIDNLLILYGGDDE